MCLTNLGGVNEGMQLRMNWPACFSVNARIRNEKPLLVVHANHLTTHICLFGR